MNQAKSTFLIAAAIAFTGLTAPLSQPAAATMLQEETSQIKKDRAFAEKVRALKERQHQEWKELLDNQAREMAATQDKPAAEKQALERQHDNDKLAMKERHREEMEELKADYKG